MTTIPPILVLSTGRCGSTMVSDMLHLHPGVLSLSEFFVPLGAAAFAWPTPTGSRMWRTYSRQGAGLHAMLRDGRVESENRYRLDAPGARYTAGTMPPIVAVTLSSLTDDPESLFDELAPIVRSQPRQPLADHYRHLFDHLRRRFTRRVWVERSGGSLMLAAKLLALFPEARIIHVFRDGRDTAMSMRHHHNFQVVLAAMRKARLDPRQWFRAPRGSRLEYALQEVVFRLIDTRTLVERSRLTLADFGRLWSDMIVVGDELLRALPPERLLTVRFEDVQRDPHPALRRLISFIDPSLVDDRWIRDAAALLKPARSRFTDLPAAERDALTNACRPGLQVLGYEP